MRFVLLIYGEEPTVAPSQQTMDQIMGQWWAYEKEIADAGVKVAGEVLQGSPTAITVRVHNGGRTVTDGPFAENRDVLGASPCSTCPTSTLRWTGRHAAPERDTGRSRCARSWSSTRPDRAVGSRLRGGRLPRRTRRTEPADTAY